jgi:hypothetical protein
VKQAAGSVNNVQPRSIIESVKDKVSDDELARMERMDGAQKVVHYLKFSCKVVSLTLSIKNGTEVLPMWIAAVVRIPSYPNLFLNYHTHTLHWSNSLRVSMRRLTTAPSTTLRCHCGSLRPKHIGPTLIITIAQPFPKGGIQHDIHQSNNATSGKYPVCGMIHEGLLNNSDRVVLYSSIVWATSVGTARFHLVLIRCTDNIR